MNKLCDRCGKLVENQENVIELQSLILSDNLLPAYKTTCRHIRCSPSSAQWIIHPGFDLVVDNREKYNKNQYPEGKRKKIEEIYTKAWLKLKHDSVVDFVKFSDD